MSKRDYYEVLGVGKSAGGDEIKKAYRRLAMKFHPDRNSAADAQEKFREASEAYEVLSNSDKRDAYDRFGHAGVDNSGGFTFTQRGDFEDIFGDLNSVFSSFFGGRGASRRRNPNAPRQGGDLQYRMELDLSQAVGGDTVSITLPILQACDECEGSGAAKGTSRSTCNECDGTGQITMNRSFVMLSQTCHHCGGTGEVIRNPCYECGGVGRVEKDRTLAVKVPPGVDEGTQLRMRSKGEAGINGGPPGDLFVVFNIKDHPIFVRDGINLHCEVPISFTQAALGAEINIPTLDGEEKLKISPGTQTGTDFRLRGRGVTSIHHRHEGKGDLLVRVTVETPVKLSDHQKDLLASFQQTLDENRKKHAPKGSSWFSSFTEFFENITKG